MEFLGYRLLCLLSSILGFLSIGFLGGGGFWAFGGFGFGLYFEFLGSRCLVLGLGLSGFVFCSLGVLWLSFYGV